MDRADITSESIKQIISNLKTPHILKNLPLNWNIFKSDFKSWCKEFDRITQEKFLFDVGSRKHPDLPHWERFRTSESISFTEFLERANKGGFEDKWVTYSYKDIATWPESLKENINFKGVGIEEAEDILFWIGSRGANTPCHYDTYGFNIVVQVFGRKRWLLFPPDTPMDITRVPYEESSIYCQQNFYSPVDLKQFSEISDKCHEIVLGPGEILVVPPKWWHYVENLDETLAINTWVPLIEEDSRARLEECFVKSSIEQITENLDIDLRLMLFNPNEITKQDGSLNYTSLFKAFGKFVLDLRSNRYKKRAHSPDKSDENLDTMKSLYETNSHIFVPIEKISRTTFLEIMIENSKRYEENVKDTSFSEEYHDIERVINSKCHPDTINICCNLYLKALEKDLNRSCE